MKNDTIFGTENTKLKFFFFGQENTKMKLNDLKMFLL